MSKEYSPSHNAEKDMPQKTWEFFKNLVKMAPVLVAGVLGFAVGEKAKKK